MSILATSPEAIRVLDMNIGNALGSFEAALILQQLHYWMEKKGVGVIVDKTKYIYNTFKDWVNSQFTFLTEWKFRQAMKILRALRVVEVIRYKSKQWNQTNYYSLNYERLREWAEAQSIEISEMWSTTVRGEGDQTLEMENPNTSIYRTKNTTKKETTKQTFGDRQTNKTETIAAASSKTASEEESSQKDSYPHRTELTACAGQNKAQSTANKTNPVEEKNVAQVDYIVNKKWKELIPLLDSTGIPINRTIKDLLKLYPGSKVENAIALVKARKREQHIPNSSGYFVSALKGDWGSKTLVSDQESSESNSQVDRGAVFRHWYDLARELGYCSGQEVRDGEQWVLISGRGDASKFQKPSRERV
ncbi:MAG: hypothetical protein WBM44_15200 [Waterburya sp.]